MLRVTDALMKIPLPALKPKCIRCAILTDFAWNYNKQCNFKTKNNYGSFVTSGDLPYNTEGVKLLLYGLKEICVIKTNLMRFIFKFILLNIINIFRIDYLFILRRQFTVRTVYDIYHVSALTSCSTLIVSAASQRWMHDKCHILHVQ